MDTCLWRKLWHTAAMSPARRRPNTSWLPTVVPTVQALLDQGVATHGFTVKTWGGHLILGRVDEPGPDPRFRLTPLRGRRYGFRLYDSQPRDPFAYASSLT